MKQLKDLTVLVLDHGLFIEQAVRLAKDCKRVLYFCPWQSAFPRLNNAYIGTGMEGVEVVEDIFGKHFNDIDLFVFPDTYYGSLQVYLEGIGKTVWGARMGEELENDRASAKRVISKLGLPVGPYKVIKGIDALREHLQENKDQWVKISKWRGTFETFFSPNYKFVEPKLDEVEYGLGAFKKIVEFVVEENLPDKVELGVDCYCIDGEFPSKLLAGIEIKDKAYVAAFKNYDDLPEPLTRIDKKLSPILKRYGYRGPYSSEVRIGKDHKPYLIDPCPRTASPPNELYQEFYLNFPEIIWAGANGDLIDPEPAGKFAAEVLIHSSWADKNWQELEIPNKIRDRVKLRNACKIDGKYYAIPQSVGLPEVGAVIGWGDTMEAAMDDCRRVAAEIDGYYIEVMTDAFDLAEEEMAKSKKYDLPMF